MTPPQPEPSALQQLLVRTGWSVFMGHVAIGFAFGTFASRVPALREGLGLSAGHLGILLLMGALGSVCALPASGLLAVRLGTKSTVMCASVLAALGHLVVALSVANQWTPGAFVGLATFGAAVGTWDAATMMEGALVEQALGRALLSKFQAGESLGTVLGASLGALVAVVSLPAHFAAAGFLYVVVAWAAARHFGRGLLGWSGPRARGNRPDRQQASDKTKASDRPQASARGGVLAVWKEPRTLLLGLVIFGATVADSAAGDWTSVSIVGQQYAGGLGASASLGAAGVAIFYGAGFMMRLAGTSLVDRLGRVTMLRVCSVVTVLGVVLFAASPWLWLALLGTLVWGMGAALGFPLGVSAAAGDPSRAAMRVAAVSTIGYTAFLLGPVVIGQVAGFVGYRHALAVVVLGPVLLALCLAGAARHSDESADAAADVSVADTSDAVVGADAVVADADAGTGADAGADAAAANLSHRGRRLGQ